MSVRLLVVELVAKSAGEKTEVGKRICVQMKATSEFEKLPMMMKLSVGEVDSSEQRLEEVERPRRGWEEEAIVHEDWRRLIQQLRSWQMLTMYVAEAQSRAGRVTRHPLAH